MTAGPDQLEAISTETVRALTDQAQICHTLEALVTSGQDTHRNIVRALAHDKNGDSLTPTAQMARRLLVQTSRQTAWTIAEMSAPSVWTSI